MNDLASADADLASFQTTLAAYQAQIAPPSSYTDQGMLLLGAAAVGIVALLLVKSA